VVLTEHGQQEHESLPIRAKEEAMKFIERIGLQALFIIVGLLPLTIFLVTREIASPEGFWQNFFLFGAGLYFLGFIQLVLLVFALGLSIALWMD
jgi:hypothetical protein